jgi:hypothetical protein
MRNIGFYENLKQYPFKERIPLASAVLLGQILISWRYGPYNRPLDIMAVAGTTVFLFKRGGKCYWFFAGIALGALLANIVSP